MCRVSAVLLVLCASAAQALIVGSAAQRSAPLQAARPARAAPVMQFGKKKKLTPSEVRMLPPISPRETRTAAIILTPPPASVSSQKLEEMGYWPGEWLCADCGYIYEPGTEPPFEELKKFWKCPQCAGPRRRFVKKAGSMCAVRVTSASVAGTSCAHPLLRRLRSAARVLRRLGTLDDSPLYIGTGIAAVVIVGLVYAGLTL